MASKSTDTSDTGAASAQPQRLTSAKPSKPLPQRAGELLQDRAGGLPVWIRAPKTGVEYHSGISRSKLYDLAGKGAIRSVSIREPGQVKGTRPFHLQSILDFIARCEGDAKDARC